MMWDPDNSRPRHRWLEVASTIVIIIAIWVARVTALDRPVTVDESRWAARAANFFSALDQRDFANAFQKEHPGVTTMWAGTAGLLWHFPDYSPGNAGQVSTRKYLGILKERGHTVLQLLKS